MNSAADELESVIASARASWPTLRAFEAEVFRGWLGERVAPGTDLATIRTVDLYLACACAAGDPAALQVFEETYLREVDIAAARARAAPGIVDEARQVVRNLLFVPRPTSSPAIASYNGRGDLRGWVRVVATREVIRLCTRDQREVAIGDDAMLDALSPADDPELEHIKSHYREQFRDAFRKAVAGLTPRERTLLRHNLIDGLGVDAIGDLYRVSRATAGRWLVRAREALLDGTRAHLSKTLRISKVEVDSVIRLIKSRLDLSLERLLRR